MNIEIIEFYPTESNAEKSLLKGTLRVKLTDLGIHILGIFVSKRKNSWFFNMPGKDGTRHDTGEQIRYPFIVFEDKDKQHGLVDSIRKEGRAFIERRLADAERPLIFPKKNQNNLKGQSAERLH